MVTSLLLAATTLAGLAAGVLLLAWEADLHARRPSLLQGRRWLGWLLFVMFLAALVAAVLLAKRL